MALDDKTYTYTRFYPFVLVFAVAIFLVAAMLATIYFEEALGTTSLVYRFVATILGFYFAASGLALLVIQVGNFLGLRKVIANGEYLTIQNLFSKTTIRWTDITEFGTYTEGFHPRVRVFYIRSKGNTDKKI